ncbi:MAG: Alpha-L-rhamnosidase domain protein [Chloroflexi bacterium]|nr:Alpha-L-rhamnosidase domain protein [Chloroflexota bacterium]
MDDQARTYHVGNAWLEREITIANGDIHSTTLQLEPRTALSSSAHELVLVLDTARWRHDIPQWRWTKCGPTGEADGYFRLDFDDTTWAVVPHLLPIFDAAYDGWAWFRQEFVLPREQRGQPISIVVGGMDDEDWTQYRLFLNEVLIAEHRGTGRWREPCTVVLEPNDQYYGWLRFGERNLLAVEVKDLRRERPDMVPGERDHYMFNSLLLDQFIAAGPPYALVNDFAVTDVRAGGEGPVLSRLELDGTSRSHPSLGVTISYSASTDAPYLRKMVTVHNRGNEPVQLLDIILEDWSGAFSAQRGGRGEPCLTSSFFFGIEHPAGVNMGGEGWLRALQLPGCSIAPAESFVSAPAVIGMTVPGQSVEQAFQTYLIGLRPRKDKRLTLYSALGWYDFTFLAAEPLSELTEELVEENLQLLEDLRASGVAFDAYMLDDWYEHTDLSKLRTRTFPQGADALTARIGATGMQPGLWFATTCAHWTCDQAPGMDAAIAAGTGITPTNPPARADKPDWVELFTKANVSDKRFCLAAEPYQGMVRQIIPGHVRELGLTCLKLDCVTLHCTSSEHEHRPGKYSMEAMVNVVLDTVAAAQLENPYLAVIWYWGFRSPWWLQHGEVAFDKGLKMEAASPASSPAPSYRQSVSLNVDQAIRHAALLPLSLQDSLGVWIGNVAWANRLGKAEWQDAFLLDAARGSSVVQLWGDLALLDRDDVDFLADALDWMRANESTYRDTILIGGDPWRAEAYGYAQSSAGRALLTVYNPSYEAAAAHVDLAALGLRTGQMMDFYEIYPYPGAVTDMAPAGSATTVAVPLMPFELRCLEVRQGQAPTTPNVQERPLIREGGRIDLALAAIPLEQIASSGMRSLCLTGDVHLPTIQRHDHIALVARLHRNGDWWYHPEPQSLLQLNVQLGGLDVYCEIVPGSRSYNGPGSPWVTYDIVAGPDWTGKELRIELKAQLPEGIFLQVEAHLYEAWWLRRKKRFLAQPR